MNASAKIDLMKLNGAFPCNFKSQNGQEFECICIPVQQAMLYRTDKSAYVNMVIKPSKEVKYDNDHYVRQNVSKKTYDEMTDEQRKQIPYLGDARVFNSGNSSTQAGQAATYRQGAAPVPVNGNEF